MATTHEQLAILSNSTGKFFYAVHYTGGDGVTQEYTTIEVCESFEIFLKEVFGKTFDRLFTILDSHVNSAEITTKYSSGSEPSFSSEWILSQLWDPKTGTTGNSVDFAKIDDSENSGYYLSSEIDADYFMSWDGLLITLKSKDDVDKIKQHLRSDFEARLKKLFDLCDQKTKELNN